MRDQNLLTVQTQTPCTAARYFGGSVSWGRYTLDAFWKASASVVPRGVQLSTGHTMDLISLRAGAAYMHRLASVRSRVFSLYGGGGAFIGYELYDPASRLPGNISTGLGDGAFTLIHRVADPKVSGIVHPAVKASLLLRKTSASIPGSMP